MPSVTLPRGQPTALLYLPSPTPSSDIRAGRASAPVFPNTPPLQTDTGGQGSGPGQPAGVKPKSCPTQRADPLLQAKGLARSQAQGWLRVRGHGGDSAHPSPDQISATGPRPGGATASLGGLGAGKAARSQAAREGPQAAPVRICPWERGINPHTACPARRVRDRRPWWGRGQGPRSRGS